MLKGRCRTLVQRKVMSPDGLYSERMNIGDTPVLDDEAWALGELFWRELVDEVLTSGGHRDEWPQWEPKFYGDGITPMEREDLAICDGRSRRLDRSFSIKQLGSTGEVPSISAWVKDYGAGIADFPDIEGAQAANEWFEQVPPRERVPRSTLFITLERSDHTVSLARSLLATWLRPETTVAEMELAIADTL